LDRTKKIQRAGQRTEFQTVWSGYGSAPSITTFNDERICRELLVNPDTGKIKQEGDLILQPRLARTLEIVSGFERADAIYNGSLTDGIVKDIQEAGGIITRKDFEDYQVEWQTPMEARVLDHTVYSAPLPGSGLILAFILNILDTMLPVNDEVSAQSRYPIQKEGYFPCSVL